METRERLISELLLIVIGGFISVAISTLLAFVFANSHTLKHRIINNLTISSKNFI